MNISNLRPANQLAQRFGVKCVCYGGPGSGKTPLVNTAPRPVLCVVEPGLASMRTSSVPAWIADTPERIDEFFKWFLNSNEVRNFDTVCVDSISQMAEIYVTRFLKQNKHGKAAYGDMSRAMMEHINGMYFMPEKNIYLIAKETIVEEGGTRKKRPYFPGQDLNVKVPHLFDEVLHLGMKTVPGFVQSIMALQTRETFDTMARDRTGKLNEYEEPNLSKLFQKAMS